MSRNLVVTILGFFLLVTLGYYSRFFLLKENAYIAEKQNQVEVVEEAPKQEQLVNEELDNKPQEPEIDIENTIVFCRSGKKILGSKLISDGLTFKLIGGNIFYNGEALERLCNPDLKEFDYDAEPSFYIIAAYKSDNDEALDVSVCENEDEIETFKKPIQVVWIAEFDGCLVGCEGASFDRLPIGGDFKYPFFAGYFGKGVFKEEFLKEGLTLKIYGKWTSIDADHPKLVFNNKCVPIVDIEKIEVVK